MLKIVISFINIIVSKAYQISPSDCDRGNTNWVSCTKIIIMLLRFSYCFATLLCILQNGHLVYWKVLYLIILNKFGLMKLVQVVWYNYIKMLENVLGEKHNILPKDLRYFVTRLRISTHSLRIQTDRYSTTHRLRIYRICR